MKVLYMNMGNRGDPGRCGVNRRIERSMAAIGRCYGGPLPMVAGAIIALGITSLLWPYLQGAERYSEPAGGTDGMWGLSKIGDFRGAYTLLSLSVIFALICGWAQRRLSGEVDSARCRAANVIMLLAMTPAAGWLARAVALPSGMNDATFAVAFLAVGVFIIAGLSRLGPGTPSSQITRVGAMQLLIAFLAMMDALGVLTCVGRTRVRAWALHDAVNTEPLAVMGLAVAAMLLLRFEKTSAGALEIKVRRIMLWIQLPLPLLFFVVVPPVTFGSSGDVYSECSWHLPFAVSLVAVTALLAWYRSLRRQWQNPLAADSSFRSCLVPVALCGVAVFMAMQSYGVPSLPTDDYHFGEFMLPWEQWRNFHKLPYVGLYPPHGFHSVFCGVLNSLFFDSSYAGMAAADGICGALVAAVTFGIAWAGWGPAGDCAQLVCLIAGKANWRLWGPAAAPDGAGAAGALRAGVDPAAIALVSRLDCALCVCGRLQPAEWNRRQHIQLPHRSVRRNRGNQAAAQALCCRRAHTDHGRGAALVYTDRCDGPGTHRFHPR